jgi:sugar lactone lactonase YvrE
VTRLDSGYVVSNGPAFTPDGRTMFHNETTRGLVYAFERDPASGELGARRVFARVPREHGLPDGMTVDAEGFLWLAHFDGWRVTRRDPEGRVERTLELPVAQVTSLAFGGPELERLFVTTAREGLSDDALRAQPLAGGLFELEPGVRGLPARTFAG